LVIANAVRWAAPVQVVGFREMIDAEHVREPLDPVPAAG
jgi:hypothetical protein